MRHPDGAMLVSTLVTAPRAAAGRALRRAAWDWAGLPSGPLGWVSSRTVLASAPVVYQKVGDACQLRADDELLDVGCGSGGFLAQQAEHVERVAGIDLSEIQVDLARRRLGERIAAGTAEIVRGDAGALPWPDGSFTVVTCMQVFEMFPDPQRVLAEVLRVLRPGGRAVLNIGERVDPGTQTHRMLGEFWVWAEDDVRRVVEQAGFTDVTTQYVAWAGDNPVEKLFGRLVGPIGGDLRLVSGLKA
jgi:ubiquinone/menaquinone biosynthesis C-methylase UbiE